MRIVSIDFETANYSDASICAAGIAVFDEGNLTESIYWLVRPPKGHGYFRPDFIEIHGLTWFDVQAAPEFPAIAPQLLERLTSADFVVAHNAWFDRRKLTGTLEHFGLSCPPLNWVCTLQLSRRVWPELPDHRLETLAAQINHSFEHHHAQGDAEAAGRAMLAMVRHVGIGTVAEFVHSAGG
jgi:DNA polymerase-3 subunit epsilon